MVTDHPGAPIAPARSAQSVWLTCWLAAYGHDARGAIAGLELIKRRAGAGPVRLNVLNSPTNLQTPRHHAAFAARADASALAPFLAQHRAAGVVLEYLPEDDLGDIAEAAAKAGLKHIAMPQAAIPISDCTEDFEHFIARRSKRERQRARRLLKLLDQPEGPQSQAPLRFSLVTRAADAAALVEQCLALEKAGWKGRAGTAVLDVPEDARFYRQLVADLARAGMLRLALLHDGAGQLVAFELCMVWERRLLALKTSCSESHLDLSPGHVLALAHIRHCCADGALDVYDVTGNGLSPAAHLLRYADRQEMLWRIILFAAGWRGSALRAIWRIRLCLRSVKRFVAKRKS